MLTMVVDEVLLVYGGTREVYGGGVADDKIGARGIDVVLDEKGPLVE